MLKWKCAAVAAAFVCALVTAASAAEPVASWTGFYVGAEGGWAHARAAQTNTVSNVSDGYYGQSGGIVGGTFGYNWQFSNWIVGLETDLAWSGIKGEETICGKAHNQICPTELRTFGTARGRVGYLALPNTMIFAAGGLAYGEIKAYKEDVAVTGGDDWRAGWTIGGGFETMFAPTGRSRSNISMRRSTGRRRPTPLLPPRRRSPQSSATSRWCAQASTGISKPDFR